MRVKVLSRLGLLACIAGLFGVYFNETIVLYYIMVVVGGYWWLLGGECE